MIAELDTRLPAVIVVTGLMASGKSTVAQALAERLPRSVHLRGDIFRKMIVNGREEMSADPTQGALDQLAARHDLACMAARTYAGLGFTVIYQDVILGPHLEDVLEHLKPVKAGVLVLNPSLVTIAGRDRARAKTAYGLHWSPETLAPGLDALPRVGHWLDTTGKSVVETVEAVLADPQKLRTGLD